MLVRASVSSPLLVLNLGFQGLQCRSGTVIHPQRESSKKESFRPPVKDAEIKITSSFSPLEAPSIPREIGHLSVD